MVHLWCGSVEQPNDGDVHLVADNLTTQSTTPATVPSSTTIATDDIAGVHYQRVKLVDGTLDGTGAIGGDATNGLDVDVTRVQGTVAVSGPLTDTQLRATAVPISDGGGSVTVDGTVAVSSVGGTVSTTALTDSQLRATPVPVSGTFWQATQPVSGTFWQATQPVSISGTIATTSTPSASTGFVKGSASATGTADTSVIAAAGVGVKNYITSIHVANTGTSTSLITLKDGSAGSTLLTTVAPALGGSNITLPIPIATSSNTALYFACGTASTTIYITAVGYTGA